jgi:Ca2+-binding RTX toxin-like protein
MSDKVVAPGNSMPNDGGFTIGRPEAGAVRVFDALGRSEIRFGFSSQGVKIVALDVDLVLVFPDGAKLVLPGLALEMAGRDDVEIAFADRKVRPQDVLAEIAEVQLSDFMPALRLISARADSDGGQKDAASTSIDPVSVVALKKQDAPQDDTLDGGDGDDTVAGGAGDDSLAGGNGFNWVDYSASSAGVNVNFLSNTASGGDAAGDTLSGFRGIIGSTGADTLRGTGTDDHIRGGAGDDFLYGESGNDTLDGGDGNDVFGMQPGNDVYIGGNGNLDHLWVGNAPVGVIADFVAGTVAIGGWGTSSVSGIENFTSGDFNDSVTGTDTSLYLSMNGGDDTAVGGLAGDLFLGMDGNDSLSGGAGSDRLEGGDGQDSLLGGTGIDTLLGGTGNDRLDGGADADSLDGGAGDDTLVGTLGTDTLSGGTENDGFVLDASSLTFGSATVSGGAGTDSVSFSALRSGVTADQLAGLLRQVEEIDFRGAGIDANQSWDAADIAAVSGSTSLTLRVDAGDAITIAEPASRWTSSTSGTATTYTIFTADDHQTEAARLIVESG